MGSSNGGESTYPKHGPAVQVGLGLAGAVQATRISRNVSPIPQRDSPGSCSSANIGKKVEPWNQIVFQAVGVNELVR